jgi:hypothetical protein
MHNDATNIFNLYQEAVEEQPQMTTNTYGSKEWYLHGKRHREDGAAIEHADGSKTWFLHGKRHREDGAAHEGADGTKQWWLHGKRHREDGAAIEWAAGSKTWWLHDRYYENAEAWAEAVLKERNQPHDAAAVDAFLRTILSKDIEEAL